MRGRVFLFGDDVDTDVMAPGGYLHMGVEALKAHCMEAIRPEFHNEVREGDIIVAGKNFGYGSAREQAAQVLKELGIRLIVAESFARIFFRNAINVGLPIGTIIESHGLYEDAYVEYSIENGEIDAEGDEILAKFSKPVGPLSEILKSGNMVQFIIDRLLQESRDEPDNES